MSRGRDERRTDARARRSWSTGSSRPSTAPRTRGPRRSCSSLVRHLHALPARGPAHRGGVEARHRVPHRGRPHAPTTTAGVHPALRHPRRLDADDHRQQPGVRGRDRGDGPRPVLRRGRAGDPARRRHRAAARPGEPLLGRGDASATPTGTRSPARGSRCGRPTRRPLRRAVRRRPASPTRGWLRADDEGRYPFWAITPTPYPIPDDGPVGDLLARDRADRRCGPRTCTSWSRRRGLPHAGHPHLRQGRPELLDRHRVRGHATRWSRTSSSRPASDPDPRRPGPRRRDWSRVRFDIVLAPAGTEA